MRAISTEALLSFLSGKDDGDRLSKLFKDAEKRKEKFYVSSYSVLELVYLLEKSYQLERERVYHIVKTLLEDKLFKVDSRGDLEEALELYLHGEDFIQALKRVEYSKRSVKEVI